MSVMFDCIKVGCPAAGKGAVKCAEIKGCPLKDKEKKDANI